jgi:radical SAM protein with 4Fe4S-binding SPASM domain
MQSEIIRTWLQVSRPMNIIRKYNSLRKRIKAIEEYYSKSPVAIHPFGIFNIELTNKCPMRCVMCPRTHNMTREKGTMSMEVFSKVIDELFAENPGWVQNNIVWLHHFGESLLHPEAGKLIRYAVSRKIKAGLSVNPLMLTKRRAEDLLQAEPFLLYVSLDGHDEQSFAKIRGVAGVYEKSYDNLLAFLRLKRTMGSTTRVVVSMIDFELNDKSIEKLQKYWTSIEGVDHFLIKPFETFDGSDATINLLRRKNEKKSQLEVVTCNRPWESVTVMWDGRVVPCCYDYNGKYVLGDVRHSRLSDIWNGERMQVLRHEFVSQTVSNPLCKNCESLRAIEASFPNLIAKVLFNFFYGK